MTIGVEEMKDHYAGSVAFDNDYGEWCDHVITRPDYKDLVEDMKEFMSRRRNSEVFFAAHIVNGVENDITEKVRIACQ